MNEYNDMSLEDTIEDILNKYKTVAIVGASQEKDRPSNIVANYLRRNGYIVFLVNPNYDSIDNMKCYPDLKSISQKIEIVDIFRKSETVKPIVEDAVAIGAKVIWMQEGIKNDEAAEIAYKAGLIVIMDRCIKKMHQKIFNI